jgi:hypothetical protein
MTTREQRIGASPVIGTSATVTEAARLMCDRGVASVPVADGERLVGILTQHDLVCGIAEGLDPTTTSAVETLDRAADVDSPEPGRRRDQLVAHVWVDLPDRYSALATLRALPRPFEAHVVQQQRRWQVQIDIDGADSRSLARLRRSLHELDGLRDRTERQEFGDIHVRIKEREYRI